MNNLILIPKIEKYIEYMLIILLKLPRTEKYSIGTEIKTSMYNMLKNILLANKSDKIKRLPIYNIVENLLLAHKKARCGKREKKKVILVELILEQELLRLEKELKNCTYKHSSYTTFKVYQPKERIIMASEYIDRIVHQWYVQHFIKPYFVPQFINTTYACIEGRGMHKASKDVQTAMKSAKSKWTSYYILKMDVTKYFHNIDKRILWDILKRKIKDKKLLWLTREILLSTEGMLGLPLGNYTSQMFANIYLNELDQYVKHKLKCKYYFRYMDDMVILLPDKEIANNVLNDITIFLKEKLGLTLNSKTKIFKDKQGVNFCRLQNK